jgi:hypothetical protein
MNNYNDNPNKIDWSKDQEGEYVLTTKDETMFLLSLPKNIVGYTGRFQKIKNKR